MDSLLSQVFRLVNVTRFFFACPARYCLAVAQLVFGSEDDLLPLFLVYDQLGNGSLLLLTHLDANIYFYIQRLYNEVNDGHRIQLLCYFLSLS